jgi:hypothetical protein
MASTPSPIIEYLRTIDAEYSDHRIVSEQEMRCLVWYFLYVQNVLSQFSMSWRGCSFRQSDDFCLLVTKVVRAGVNEVVYTSGRTPLDCVRIFTRKWHQDTLEYVPDKFA